MLRPGRMSSLYMLMVLLLSERGSESVLLCDEALAKASTPLGELVRGAMALRSAKDAVLELERL
jgi:hypothetical protein